MDSLEENISYTLMGKYNLRLYPYITTVYFGLNEQAISYDLKDAAFYKSISVTTSRKCFLVGISA